MNSKMQTMQIASLAFTGTFTPDGGAPVVRPLGMQVPRPWGGLRDRGLTAH